MKPFAAYTEGVAGVEEIDTVMKLGTAQPMGPLAEILSGWCVPRHIESIAWWLLAIQSMLPVPLLVNMVTAGKLGVKTVKGFMYIMDLVGALCLNKFSFDEKITLFISLLISAAAFSQDENNYTMQAALLAK